MFRQLDYQDRTLASLEAYLDMLKDKKGRADRIAALVSTGTETGSHTGVGPSGRTGIMRLF
jgi:type III restriction enzyme